MTHKRRTRPLPILTRTIIGVPPPLHLPAKLTDIDSLQLHSDNLHCRPRDPDDTIVVDVEVNAAGQIVIIGAERVP